MAYSLGGPTTTRYMSPEALAELLDEDHDDSFADDASPELLEASADSIIEANETPQPAPDVSYDGLAAALFWVVLTQ